MAASTISNSGGPGSPTELSPVTIAVRDKVIEKFQDQPLKEMNESLKMLLSNEQDEQKRLGILAARVYILRQRIATLAEPVPERVVSAASPKPLDTGTDSESDVEAGGDTSSEWTRLRILDDCEVNGVRFPKTVIIDVKSSDAQRLIDSGNAELVEEPPETASDAADPEGGTEGDTSAMQVEIDAAPSDATDPDTATAADSADANEDVSGKGATDETGSEAMPEAASPAEEASAAPDATDEAAADTADDITENPEGEAKPAEESKDAVIEAPSAAEVTAALEALGAGPGASDETTAASEDGNEAAEPTASLAETSPPEPADISAADDDEAAAVAAELEAAATAMAAPSSPPDAGESDDDAKPSGWFEAQQNAEKAAKAEAGDEPESDKEDESPADEKS
ncbi:MAG: hypothetical protein VW989_12280 [Rhodobiaceae bacterium]